MIDGKRLRPLWLVLVVVVLVIFGWLPDGQLSDADRQNKPRLMVVYNNVEVSAATQALAEDIQSRLAPRHEWRLVDELSPLTWQLTLAFSQPDGQLEVFGQLRGPASEIVTESFKVEGQTEVSSNLADRVVKLSIESVERVAPQR